MKLNARAEKFIVGCAAPYYNHHHHRRSHNFGLANFAIAAPQRHCLCFAPAVARDKLCFTK